MMNKEIENVLGKDLVMTYVETRGDLQRFVLSKLKSAEEAEDIVQQVYLQIIKITQDKLDTIRDNRQYLFGIANILILRYLRAQGQNKEQQIASGDDVAFDRGDEASEPSLEMESEQMMQLLKQVIDDMPAKRRQVFLYYRFKNMAIKDIADQLDMSVASVEKHLVRAMLQCKESLKGGGYVAIR